MRTLQHDEETKRTLENILRPIWKLTHYSGVSFDWCRPMPANYSACSYIRYFSVTVSFCLLLPMTIFQFTQLLLAIKNGSSIHSIVTNLTWLAPLPVTVFTFLKFVYNRWEFLRFFQDWKKLEKEFQRMLLRSRKTNKDLSKSKIHSTMYFAYSLMALISIVSVFIYILKNSHGSFLLSTYLVIRESIPLPLIMAYHVSVFIMIWILAVLTDVVPAFVYFHFSRYIACLEQNAIEIFSPSASKRWHLILPGTMNRPGETGDITRSTLDLDGPVRLLWIRVEHLNGFVIRANSLFGALMVLGQGNSVFMMTVGLYAVLYALNHNLNRPVTFITNLLFLATVAFRFISCTLISSQLYQSVTKLRDFLTDKVGRNWVHIGENDRQLLCSFIERLQYDNIVACPLGLYNITPSTLLTVLGLVVSYVVVLLGAK